MCIYSIRSKYSRIVPIESNAIASFYSLLSGDCSDITSPQWCILKNHVIVSVAWQSRIVESMPHEIATSCYTLLAITHQLFLTIFNCILSIKLLMYLNLIVAPSASCKFSCIKAFEILVINIFLSRIF